MPRRLGTGHGSTGLSQPAGNRREPQALPGRNGLVNSRSAALCFLMDKAGSG